MEIRLPYNIQLILFLVVLVVGSCVNDLDEVQKFVDPVEEVGEYALNVEIYYSDSAEVKARIKAPKVTSNVDLKNPGMEFTEGLRVEFFGPNQRVNSWLDAKYAKRYERDEYTVAQDSVVFKNSNGDIMKTAELIWDEKKGIVYTDRPIKFIKTNGEVIFGYGFQTNEDFTRYEISRGSGFIKLDGLPDDLND